MSVLTDNKGKEQIIQYVKRFHRSFLGATWEELSMIEENDLVRIYWEAKRYARGKYAI